MYSWYIDMYIIYNIMHEKQTHIVSCNLKIIKLIIGKTLSKHSLHEKTAASVLLKPKKKA